MPWTRVKDKVSGHEYSVQYVDKDAHEVIKKDAEDRFGRPLPAKPRVGKGGTTKEGAQ